MGNSDHGTTHTTLNPERAGVKKKKKKRKEKRRKKNHRQANSAHTRESKPNSGLARPGVGRQACWQELNGQNTALERDHDEVSARILRGPAARDTRQGVAIFPVPKGTFHPAP